MAKMSCFPALLAGRKKKHRKVADAVKVSGCNDCPKKVKPVEFIVAPVAPVVVECGEKVQPRDVKVAAANYDAAAPVADCKGGDQPGEKEKASSVKEDDTSSHFEFELHAAKKSVGSDDAGAAEKGGDAVAAPEQDTAVAAEASAKLKRSCSNIEIKRPGPREATVAPPRSRSYGDLRDLLPTGLAMDTTTPRGAPDASPASVKTSRAADRVMLKKRSSSQVLPSRSRKLWWRLFLWSHRNLHRPRPAAACSPGRQGGYTSDTHADGPNAADRRNKKVMVDGSPPPTMPVPNQWVAFSAENSLLDRVSAWVSSIENEPFRIAEDDEHDDVDDGDEFEAGECAARPRAIELGEPSSGKGHGKSKLRSVCVKAENREYLYVK